MKSKASKSSKAQGIEKIAGVDCLRVTEPIWTEIHVPQVWHDSWRNGDRILRYAGRCVTCQRRTFAFDDGENDPRGILGDHAACSMHASDYAAEGEDIPQCFMCANEEPSYRRALEIGRSKWKDITRSYVARDGVATFECACGENLSCEVGKPGKRVRPVCQCGRAWIITYQAGPDAAGNGTAAMAED